MFGLSVSISGDTALVGALEDDVTGRESGSAYIFTRTGLTWTQQAKLTASDAAAVDLFGRSVSIDGDTAIVGASLDDDAAGGNQGSAYVFTSLLCVADLNGDGTTDGSDLLNLLGGWGNPGLTDLDGDGTTDGTDLLLLLGGWGPCP